MSRIVLGIKLCNISGPDLAEMAGLYQSFGAGFSKSASCSAHDLGALLLAMGKTYKKRNCRKVRGAGVGVSGVHSGGKRLLVLYLAILRYQKFKITKMEHTKANRDHHLRLFKILPVLQRVSKT